MSELYLVRHGQASFGQANYDQLSPLGTQQGQLLGEYFKARGIQFDRIVSGNMARHLQTCAAIQAGSGCALPITQQAHWNEFDFEQLVAQYLQQHPEHRPAPNAPRKAFYTVLKQSLLAWSSGQLDETPLPETWQAFQQRVSEGLGALQATADSERVLVVSSGGAIAMAAAQLLSAPAHTMVALNLQMANTGLSRCFYNAHTVQLHNFNTLPHLDTPAHADKITFS
ncbi:histidine phosphatase family protein [Simiduia sp. 21SJ11W-1]|uniref:histidine phosphatase family protein n=1 Tax=Simiduia sp. 21SJ11W-1 TaxID=2909669 RepID=UPI0020A0B7A8|nr:histidine phosphatase family protein [Simiduia sp. 21SJ11W-1]UTA47314.1 histidine phosphatase family protein [Simiduia sp. 21SJ11W-1]